LEEAFGRERFDAFLRAYFEHFAFQSIVTAEFVEYLEKNLFGQAPEKAAAFPLGEWLYKPGLPASAPKATSEAFTKVSAQANGWMQGTVKLEAMPAKGWTTHEWLHFLKALPSPLDSARMASLDRAFRLSESGNAEILFQWLLMSIQANYRPADRKLEEFLIGVGRRKYIKPLYQELAKTPDGKQRAKTIYEKARPGYHPIAVTTVDDLLK